MDATTVSFAGVVATGVIGVGGVALAWREQRLRRELAMADREHQRQLAQDERIYADRRDVYVEVQGWAERGALMVQRTDPMIGPLPPPPEMPSDDEELILLQSRVAELGSEEVNAALDRFAQNVAGFRRANWLYHRLQSQEHGAAEAGVERERLRGEVREALLAMARQIRSELAQP